MVLADTSGIFALVNRKDRHHAAARKWYASVAGAGETFVITQPLLTESWRLIYSKIGLRQADSLWESVLKGLFLLVDLDLADLSLALKIQHKYADSEVGFVDATTFAACERHHINQVFTFDHAHFGIYRPSFAEYLKLLPSI